MALALTVDKIDTIPEALRGEYVEKDGKFHLNVDGLPDVTGLKNTVNALRGEKDSLAAQIKQWATLGKQPDEVSAMLETERKEKEAALLKAGKFDDVLRDHVGKVTKEKDEAIGAATKQRDSALDIARNALVNTGLTGALTKAKATAEGVAALPKLIGDRVKVEFNDAHEALHTIMSADGKSPMYGADGKPATYDDLVKEATKNFPSLFEGTGAGGGGAPLRNGKGGAKTMSRADFNALPLLEQASKMKDKWTLYD